MALFSLTDATRLWEKVEKQPGDGCWPFTGARDPKGYGNIWAAGRQIGAHRLAWELANGPIPPGLQVRHVVCDNPPCCRLDHLGIGTSQDDANDRTSKGRQARGEQHGSAKLTEPRVQEIKRLAASGLSQIALARRFGVDPATIRRILTGRNWAHVGDRT